MAIRHLERGHHAAAPAVTAALERLQAGDRSGFPGMLDGMTRTELGLLHVQLNNWTRAGRIDPIDAAVALFDIVQARRANESGR